MSGGYDFEGARAAGISEQDIAAHLRQKALADAEAQHAAQSGVERGTQAGARAFTQGTTLGFGDEAAAAVRAAAPGFAEWMMTPAFGSEPTQTVSKAATFQDRYDEELAKVRGQLATDEAHHPRLVTGGKIAGNVATTALLPGALLRPTGSLAANVAKVGGTGAALGGAQGVGEGEGGTDRLNKGITGAAFGSAAGALPIAGTLMRAGLETRPGQILSKYAIAPVYQGIAKALQGGASVADKFSPGATTGAASADVVSGGGKMAGDTVATRLADNMRGIAGSAEASAEAARDTVKAGAVRRLAQSVEDGSKPLANIEAEHARLGPAATIADAAGELSPLQRYLRLAKTMGGEANNYLQEATRARRAGNVITGEGGSGSRLGAAAESAFGGGDFAASLSAAEKKLADDGALYYSKLKDAPFKPTPELTAQLEKPAVQTALKNIDAAAANQGKTLAPLERLHRVKQQLYRDAQTERVGMADVAETDAKFRTALQDSSPEVKAADAAYAHDSRAVEMHDSGIKFMQGATSTAERATAVPGLEKQLADASPVQAAAFLAGAKQNILDQTSRGANVANRLANNLEGNQQVYGRLNALLGERKAKQFLEAADSARIFQRTDNSIIGGSNSLDKAADIGKEGMDIVHEIASDPIMGGAKAVYTRLAKALLEHPTGSEAVRSEAARLGYNVSAPENAKTFEDIARALGTRRNARLTPATTRAGAAAGANQFGNSGNAP